MMDDVPRIFEAVFACTLEVFKQRILLWMVISLPCCILRYIGVFRSGFEEK
jgi:hypothetical protein